MHSKTLIRTISVFLLAIAIGSTCVGADLPKFSIDLTTALNERCNERVLTSINRLQDEQQERWAKASRMLYGHHHNYSLGCYFRRPSLPPIRIFEPQRSTHRLPDDPIGTLTTAFQTCTSLQTLVIGSSNPAGIHFDELTIADLLSPLQFLGETKSSDAFAIRFVYKLLFQTLQPADQFNWFPKESAEEEINDYKHLDFDPTMIFEFKGKDWLRVEIDTGGLQAIIRTKDQWGAYSFDRLSAIAIEARVKDLQSLYASPPADD